LGWQMPIAPLWSCGVGKMKLLGLDIGDKRVGVAFGDTELRIATPVDVFVRTDFDQDAQRIAGYVRDYDADKIVAGLPRNTDGTVGPQAQATQAFAERMAQTIRVPLVLWDEHLTTVEASRQVQSEERPPRKAPGQRRGKKTRRSLDAVAAAIILQDYMQAQENKSRQDAS
jgi:putative Holliday junction resolvase